MGDEHAPNTQNSCHGNFIARRHAQIPNHKRRQQTDGEIGDGRSDTIHICDIDEDIGVDARAVDRKAIPEIVDGRALEDGEKEEQETDDNRDRHGGVENNDVEAIDGDPEEGEDNGDFGQNAGEDVEHLTEVPALFIQSS